MPSPSLSPRVQSFSAPAPTSDQAKTLFEQGLSQMAYNVLLSKLPNVAPDVVTFKILDSDPEAGNGVGSFVVQRAGLTFYIPVVMAENQVKPLDLLFYKDMNVFLPLSKDWLEQLGKQSVGELGQGVKPPNTLTTDVDIRNTVVPPTTGRYSYASEQAVEDVFMSLAQTPEQPKLAFLDFLSKSPNRVKKAAAELFETKPKLLKLAAKFYGKTALTEALTFTREKKADYGKRLPLGGGAVFIADKSTEAGKFKEFFGDDAGIAYQGMLLKGYHAKDTRPELKHVLKVEPYIDFKVPNKAGAYRIWKSDGTPLLAFILGNPTDLINPTSNLVHARNIRFSKRDAAPANPNVGAGVNYRTPGPGGTDDRVFINHYVGVTEDGKLISTDKLLGSEMGMGDLEGSRVYKKTVGAAQAAGPRVGQTGFFVMRKGHTFVGTTPVKIEAISNDSEGTQLLKISSGHGTRTLAIHKDHANGRILVPSEGLIRIPANYSWVPTSGELESSDIMSNPKDVLCWAHASVTKTAAERFIVKKAYHGFTFGEVSKDGFDFVPALRKLATDAGISVDAAESLLKEADTKGRAEFYAMTPADRKKYRETLGDFDSDSGDVSLDSHHKLNPGTEPKNRLANKKLSVIPLTKFAEEGAPPKQDPNQPPADPAQQAMDATQMAQMGAAPQGPSPIDMAVAEQMQNLQAQMGALTQMQQLMQTVQQRANQIAGTGGVQGNPAAAAAAMGGPMDPSMMGAGAPVQGQDPSTQGAPAPGGQPGQPGMDPSQMQGQPPPQQGAPAPGGQPGQPQQPDQDPNAQQQQQPPQAMMSADDGDLNSLAQQVNPQFMEQAGQLNDAGTFDAAALASMAQSPVLRDLVQAYLPNLEKSLDNIGRVLLTLWMDESHVKEDVGAETYVGLEENLRTVFKGLGDLILKVNQNALVLRDRNESIFQG